MRGPRPPGAFGCVCRPPRPPGPDSWWWERGSTSARTLETCWGDEFAESDGGGTPLGRGENLLDWAIPGEGPG